MRFPVRVAALLVALALAAGVAAAAPGDLDPTFGNGGRAIVGLGGVSLPTAVALQPDGRILVAATRGSVGSQDAVVARVLAPQGALDPSFAGGAGFSVLGVGVDNTANDVVVQSDGRIVVAGSRTDGVSRFGLVARLSSSGVPEADFGSFFALEDTEFFAAALQPDGAIVTAGRGGAFPARDMVVARFTPGLAVDTGYGGGFGWSRLNFPRGTSPTNDEAVAVALQNDGRIVVAGQTNSVPLTAAVSMAAARLVVPGGTFDPSFGLGGDGREILAVGDPVSAAADVIIAPDGGILLAGYAAVRGRIGAVLARLRPDGRLDQAFASDGVVVAPGTKDEVIVAAALQRDGKIVVVGDVSSGGGPSDILVRRFQPNGLPDSTFGVEGRVVIDLGAEDLGRAVAIQPDGRIVVAGSTGRKDIGLVRLAGDGAGAGGTGPGGGPGGGSSAAPRCGGRVATMVGTPGRDRLRGTPGPDVIAGLGGSDSLDGRGGADIICGGSGDDVLTGGAGADILIGGAGADRLRGGVGRDRLLGGAGADRLFGGGGRDVLVGGPGRNVRVQ